MFWLQQEQKRKECLAEKKPKKGLVFEISSDDGFQICAESIEGESGAVLLSCSWLSGVQVQLVRRSLTAFFMGVKSKPKPGAQGGTGLGSAWCRLLSHFSSVCGTADAWKSLTDKVQEARSNARLKQLSFAGNSRHRLLPAACLCVLQRTGASPSASAVAPEEFHPAQPLPPQQRVASSPCSSHRSRLQLQPWQWQWQASSRLWLPSPPAPGPRTQQGLVVLCLVQA